MNPTPESLVKGSILDRVRSLLLLIQLENRALIPEFHAKHDQTSTLGPLFLFFGEKLFFFLGGYKFVFLLSVCL